MGVGGIVKSFSHEHFRQKYFCKKKSTKIFQLKIFLQK